MLERRLLVQFGIQSQPDTFSDQDQCQTAKQLTRLFVGDNPKCIQQKFFKQGHRDVNLLPTEVDQLPETDNDRKEVPSRHIFGSNTPIFNKRTYENNKSSAFFLNLTQGVDGSEPIVKVHWYEDGQKNEKLVNLAQFEGLLPPFPVEEIISHLPENILNKVKLLCDYRYPTCNIVEQFKLAKKSDQAIIQSFFDDSENAQSLIFYFNFNDGDHTFIIEKIVENNQVGWVVYQSWLEYSNLFEWLGLEPWPYKENDENEHLDFGLDFKKYGGGKLLNVSEILNFISDVAAGDDRCDMLVEVFPHNLLTNMKTLFPQNQLIQSICLKNDPLNSKQQFLQPPQADSNQLAESVETSSTSSSTSTSSGFFQQSGKRKTHPDEPPTEPSKRIKTDSGLALNLQKN